VQADTCTPFLCSTSIDAHKSAFIANLLSCTLRDCQYTTYNNVRPHQALGNLTPQQFLRQIPSQTKGMKSVTHLLDEYIPLTGPLGCSILRFRKSRRPWSDVARREIP